MADWSSYLGSIGGGGGGAAPVSSSAHSGISFGATTGQLALYIGGGLAVLLILILLLKK
jgi:hypothetical protein